MLQIFHPRSRASGLTVYVAAFIWGVFSSISTVGAQDQKKPIQIVGFGDSLMAGYELPEGDGFTAVLQSMLKTEGLDAVVTNAGVSGDTSSGGLERIDWSVPDGTNLVILELGANDALRGIAPEITRENIDHMITRLKERNISVVLAGMHAPPNLGVTYETAFNTIFPDLAAKHDIPLIPFFLEGVAAKPDLQLPDRLHPNRKGVDVMVANSIKFITPMIAEILAPK
jgi:acyl-CoA thioesterase I